MRDCPTKDLEYIIRREVILDLPYPATICATRYSGTYEGARYVSFPLRAIVAGSTAFAAEDQECAEFWMEANDLNLPIGRGSTPDEALEDMRQRLELWVQSFSAQDSE